MGHQRAAHEHDGSDAVDEAEFAERVGDVNVDVALGQIAARAQARPKARPPWRFRRCLARAPDGAARSRSSRVGNFARSRRCAAMMVVSSPGCVEAAATTARSPISALKRCNVGWSTGGAGTSSFRLPVEEMRGAPSREKRCALAGDWARQRSKRFNKRGDRARNEPPAAERAFRYAAVDEDQRDFALGAGQDEIGPQIRLDEQRQVGPPMVEEPGDEGRRVERDELVDHPLRQALLGERRRGDGAGALPGRRNPARGCARSAEPLQAFRRRWRSAPRSKTPPGAAGSASPRRSARRVGCSLPRSSRSARRRGASGVATRVANR